MYSWTGKGFLLKKSVIGQFQETDNHYNISFLLTLNIILEQLLTIRNYFLRFLLRSAILPINLLLNFLTQKYI